MAGSNISTYAGVMLGADGRPKVIVDYGVFMELINKAGIRDGDARKEGNAPFTLEELESVTSLLNDLEAIAKKEDAIDIAAANAAEKEEALPLDVAKKLINGDNPIKVYRKYRGLSQRALADKVGSKPVYISQIETGASNPSTKLLRKLAKALDVRIDDLVD